MQLVFPEFNYILIINIELILIHFNDGKELNNTRNFRMTSFPFHTK